MCSYSYFNMRAANEGAPYTCAYVAKYRSIEGSTEEGLDQLIMPIIAAGFSLLPGVTLLISTIIRNERSVLALLEAGKVFIIFIVVLWVLGMYTIYQLTFDCRWYDDKLHGNQDACNNGATKYNAGASISIVVMVLLLAGITASSEVQRRAVRNDCISNFGD